MENYKKRLEEQLKEIDVLIAQTDDSIENSDGLSDRWDAASKGNGYDQFLWVDKTTGKRRYIRAEEKDALRKAVQRDYETAVNTKLKQMRKPLEKFLKDYDINEIDRIYNRMADSKKKLVTPVIETDEAFLARWKNVSYEPMPIESETEFYSKCGVRVRSKSELMIADELEQRGIPYRYEFPLFLKKAGNVRPDFLCLNVRTRSEFIWEHFGMMDNSAYANKNTAKIQNYGQNGYIPGKNMILTFESSQFPLSSVMIRKMIEEYLV